MAPTQALSPITTTKVPTTPATPVSPLLRNPSTPVSQSPGNWTHPKWKEIARRQRAQVFDHTNVNRIVVNAAILIITFYGSTITYHIPNVIYDYILAPIICCIPQPFWMRFFLRIMLCYNIIYAFRPFYSTPDNIPDVDLNASQRKLVGLDPRATPPPTSNTKYTTPPKYPVSNTPRTSSTGTPGSQRSLSSSFNAADTPSRSPLHRNNSDSGMRPGGSGHNTEWKSPVYRRQAAERKYREQMKIEERLNESAQFRMSTPPRQRTGSLFAQGGGSPRESIFAPNTPSPTGHASVQLNSRWAVRRSSSGSRSFT